MGAQAELLILPEMSQIELRQTMNRLDRAMADSARRAGNEFEEELERGVMAGIKRGAKKAGRLFKSGYDKAGGAGGAGTSLIGLIMGAATAGGMANIQRAAEGGALIEERLSNSDTKALMGAADLIGLDAGSIKKLWTMAQRAGFDDVKDFTDILTNINLKTTEAEIGEDPLLNQFKGMRGIDLYSAIFASLANAKPEEALRWMDKLEAGERLPEMSTFLSEMRAASGGKVAMDWMRLSNDEAQAGLDMLKEERLATDFHQRKIMLESERNAALTGAITPSKLDAWASEQRRIRSEELTRIRTYEQNLQASQTYMNAAEGLMTTMAEHSAETVDLLKRINKSIEDRGMVRTATDLMDGEFDYGKAAKRGG